jgi:hypothetical protein
MSVKSFITFDPILYKFLFKKSNIVQRCSGVSLIEEKSAASFCRQVAELVLDMFCNFYLLKNHKIASNSATTKAREKISTYLESLELNKFFDVCLSKFENYKYLLNSICHRFLVTTKPNGV